MRKIFADARGNLGVRRMRAELAALVKLVIAEYRKAGLSIPNSDTAKGTYNYYADRGQVGHGAPPAGALIFWPGPTQYGHVVIAVDGGSVVSTRGTDGDNRPNAQVAIGRFGTPAGSRSH
jgi:hypothetical protein